MKKESTRMNHKEYFNYVFSLPYPKTKQLYIMRTYVDRVELKNLYFFTKKKKIVFDKYNIIQGDKKTGKTFLSYLIYNAYMFNDTFLEHPPLDFTGFNDVSLRILYHSMTDWRYILPKKKKFNNMHHRWHKRCHDEKNNDICFLFDEPDLIYNTKERDGFLNYLKDSAAQMIITSDLDKNISYPKEYKIIKI